MQTGAGREEGTKEGENPGEPQARGVGRCGGERGEAGRLDGARREEGEGEEERARPRWQKASRVAASGTRGTGEAEGAEPWARGKGVGEEGGGVSQAMATEPIARTGETGAGEGATGEGRPRTGLATAAPRPAGGGSLNAGSNRGQTFLLRVFLLKLARVEAGELRTSST